MKKLVKKIASLSILILSIACFSISYAETEIINEVPVTVDIPSEAGDNLLLTFMKDSQVLFHLVGALEAHEDLQHKELPFYALYAQLKQQLIELVAAEVSETMEESKELVDGKANALDLAEIVNNEERIVKDLAYVQEGLTDAENKELLRLLFRDTLGMYQKFVEQNKDLLDGVQKIADDGFKINGDKKCRSFQGKEFCIEGSNGQEFKTLSEIALYVKKMLDEKPNEAPIDQQQATEVAGDALAPELSIDGSIALNEQKAVEIASAEQAPEVKVDQAAPVVDEPAAPEAGL